MQQISHVRILHYILVFNLEFYEISLSWIWHFFSGLFISSVFVLVKKNIHIQYFKKTSHTIIKLDLKIIEVKQLFKLVRKCLCDVSKSR